jgi:hypothetical protein
VMGNKRYERVGGKIEGKVLRKGKGDIFGQ